jgi:hypothetical protein
VGVITAAWPMIQVNKGFGFGMLILLIGIISNAAGSVYFVGTNWDGINLLTINAWQTLIGALLLLPLCLYFAIAARIILHGKQWQVLDGLHILYLLLQYFSGF